ncbi:two-component system sensor histidine kinase NtrB [Thermoanaerobacterium sp. DL9XJH110]|uniref:two-component system sensor histidine kinase NtrB n=1 Tax=Thermoanaerobacterium sp. DL9XJH110 TaxID=3386643 RepID=UPI003BB6273A
MGDGFRDGAFNLLKYAEVYEDMLAERVDTVLEAPLLFVREGNHRIVIENRDEENANRSYVYDVSTSLFEDSEGPLGVIVSYEDKGEIEKLRENLTRIESLAVSGELAASAVHEIKNPLFSIRGFLQLLENSLGKDDRRREYTHIMISELDRLRRIVEDFLILSRQQIKKNDRIYIDKLMEEVLNLFKARFTETVSCRLDMEKDLWVYGDKDQLKQAFLNLIQNSLEAITKEGNIFIKSRRQEDKIIVEIKDDGVGIKEGNREKLFKPFFTTKENGTGLGLYITKRIIQNHGGKIRFESKEGEGTTFFVELPF